MHRTIRLLFDTRYHRPQTKIAPARAPTAATAKQRTANAGPPIHRQMGNRPRARADSVHEHIYIAVIPVNHVALADAAK
jgi:hypothetical protein